MKVGKQIPSIQFSYSEFPLCVMKQN